MSAWMISDDHADLLASAYCQLIDPTADPQAVGQALLVENAKSLAYRYGDNDNFAQADAYRHRPWPAAVEPIIANAAARCAEYQACEHGADYEASETHRRLAELILKTGGLSAGRNFSELPWGIEFTHRAAAEAGKTLVGPLPFRFYAHEGGKRAILVDPFAKVIVEGYQMDGLHELYTTLGCSCIDIRGIGEDPQGNPLDMICDDEGRLKDGQLCFRMGGHLLAGRVLLMSHDDEGEAASTALPVSEVVKRVEWCSPATDYTPPAPIIIGLDDLETARKFGLI